MRLLVISLFRAAQTDSFVAKRRYEREVVNKMRSEDEEGMQFLSDIVDISVERPSQLETTALGSAMLAGLADGVFSSIENTASSWRLEKKFTPNMTPSNRRILTERWSEAVMKTRFSIM